MIQLNSAGKKQAGRCLGVEARENFPGDTAIDPEIVRVVEKSRPTPAFVV
jgi:hypothetical protein